MEEEEREKIALFKFGLIGAAVNKTFSQESLMAFFRAISNKKYQLPNGKEVQYSSTTLKKWYLMYQNKGLDGLKPHRRSDAGIPRSLSDHVKSEIFRIKEKYPHITGTLVYQKLIEDGTLKQVNSSLSSVLRFIKDNNLKPSQLNTEEIKAFEFKNANDFWQIDTSYGPKIKINNDKITTHIICIIDDASRYITHIEIFERDNSLNVQAVLKKAVSKHGIPSRLYTDNGGPYINHQLRHICASIGTVLSHHTPYAAHKKGKVERFFRTLKDKWMHGLDWNDFNNLEDLNTSLNTFLNNNYMNTKHSALETTPRLRFLQDYHLIKYLPEEELEKCFHHKLVRTVNKDSTIRVLNKSYEVPQKYIRQKIILRFNPINIKEAYIVDYENKVLDTISLVNKVDNSNGVRKQINYMKSVEGGN